jgi:DNA-directed RNA polymerase specialized sigma24 family protein
MTWKELYPVVKEQADYAVLRYDERRQDKVQELVCQPFEKYQHDVEAGREIKKNSFKPFVTKRAKEVDVRSICKDGYGGTSQKDVLGYFNRRPDSKIIVTDLQEWMPISTKSKEAIDEALVFNVDFSRWINRLNNTQKRIVEYLIQGFCMREIAKKIAATVEKVKAIIRQIQKKYLNYFDLETCQ